MDRRSGGWEQRTAGAMLSTSRKWFWIVAGALLLGVAASTLYLVSGRGPHEPVYEGVGLSAWLDGTTVHGGGLAQTKKMSEVLNSVGPEALPWLTHTFEINNGKEGLSKLHQRYVQFLSRQPQGVVVPACASNPAVGNSAL